MLGRILSENDVFLDKDDEELSCQLTLLSQDISMAQNLLVVATKESSSRILWDTDSSADSILSFLNENCKDLHINPEKLAIYQQKLDALSLKEKSLQQLEKQLLRKSVSHIKKVLQKKLDTLDHYRSGHTKLLAEITEYKSQKKNGKIFEKYFEAAYQRKENTSKEIEKKINSIASELPANRLVTLTQIFNQQEDLYESSRSYYLSQMGMDKHAFYLLITEDTELQNNLAVFIDAGEICQKALAEQIEILRNAENEKDESIAKEKEIIGLCEEKTEEPRFNRLSIPVSY